MSIFENILKTQPLNLDALWGRAEVLRRSREFQESEELLQIILKENPRYIPALLSYAYIKYRADDTSSALKLTHQALKFKGIDKSDEAIANMLLGTINSRLSQKGWFFGKIRYGTQIKNYFLKAEKLDPGLPEVHLGLGTFYLKAPHIIGGSLEKAFKELNLAFNIAPEFATVNARLAQAYKMKGDLKNFRAYLDAAKKLDPENEAVQELENEK
jgi:tetratricopeptide (TPR) repeat protein